MKKGRATEELESHLKSVMDYNDEAKCCGTCLQFKPSDEMSRAPDSKPNRCEANLVWFPVVSSGICNFYDMDIDKYEGVE